MYGSTNRALDRVRKLLEAKPGRLQEGFSSTLYTLSVTVRSVKDSLRDIEGLIYYRLHGKGAVADLSGEEVLSKEDKTKVQKLEKSIAEFKKNVDKLEAEAKALYNEAKALDPVMKYL